MAPVAGDIQFFIDTVPAAKPVSGKIKYHNAALAPIGSTIAAAEDESAPPQVLRSENPLYPLSSSAAETSTTIDYFSLEVDDDKDNTGTPTRTPVTSPLATPTKEQERTLEGSWFRTDCRFRSPMLQLHKEILDFCDFLSPTPEEREARHNAIDAVFDVIKFIWPHCKAEVFGSFRTGLYLPTSDIDVVIMESRISRPQLGLQALSRALSQRGIAKKIQVIAKARVPIIKFVEKKSGFSFDISFDVDNGPKAADFIKDAVMKWPPLRPLCLILKIFLQQRELNEVYTGGIGSYALLSMLIAMLQNYQSGKLSPEHNLGVLLVQFFDLYGRKLNTADVGVSCDRGGTFFLKSMKGFTAKSNNSFVISIQDPQTPDNDIGKSSFNYFQVKSAFSMAFTTLTNAKTIMKLGPNRSILGTIIRPDAELLERKGGSNGDVTFNKLLPGAGDPLPDQNGGHGDMYCNWQFGDEDDEPLPRDDVIIAVDGEAGSSGKKRKKPGEKRSSKKLAKAKKNAEIGSAGPEQNGSKTEKKDKKDKHGKKLRWRLRPYNSS